MDRLWTKQFVLMIAGTTLLFIAFYTLYPTLPLFITHLGGGDTQVGLAMGVFMLASVVFRPIVGSLLDRLGRRIFVVLGLVLFGLAMYLYSRISSVAGLLWLRALHGMSWAFASTSIQTAVTDLIPPARRGEGLGWLGGAMTVAMAIGPAWGVWVARQLSYQALFFSGTGLAAVALIVMVAVKYPEVQKARTHVSHSVSGTRLSIASTWPILVSVFFIFVAYSSITTFLPLFATSVRVSSDTYFMALAASLILMRPLGGKLSDRHGETVVVAPALVIATGGLVVLSFSHGLPGLLISAVLYGIGYGTAQPVLLSVAIRLAGNSRRGAANAAVTTATDLGIGLGSMALGSVAQNTSYRVTFVTAAIAVSLSFLVFVVFAGRHRRARPVQRS